MIDEKKETPKISEKLYKKVYLELAEIYSATRTCKHCGKPTLRQYLCVHCHKD